MSNRRIVDTNLVVRHLVQDDERNAKVALRLFEACDRGEVRLVLLPAVIAECVFVLESFYRHPRTDIAQALAALIGSPGVELADRAIHIDALGRYRRTKLHFVDCMIAAAATAEGVSVATLDRGFKKFPDVRIDVD